jgi:hypothetical protein
VDDTVEQAQKRKKQWGEYSTLQQASMAFIGTLQVVLTLWALVDLLRRPTRRLRGTKLFWLPTVFLQPFGPPAYLIFGRRGD